MDPNRHHEFIANNEDRTRSMYANRETTDIRTHTQYYSQNRTETNKKMCGCANTTSNTMCNECRLSTADGWSTQHMQRPDVRNVDSRSILRQQSPLYMHSNVSSRPPYWHQGSSSLIEESLDPNKAMVAPHMDRNLSSNSCTLDNNYNYNKPHQQQPQSMQRVNAMGTYPKDRFYDEKYPQTKLETHMGTKVGYAPVAPPTTNIIYNVNNHSSNMGSVRSAKLVDEHIINPINILASKEQQPSPNYARKCPQIFPPEEQNSAHLNLYMSTPQFSSEKFVNIQTQQKTARDLPSQEYRDLSSSTAHMHCLPETSKLRKSPLQLPSLLSNYATQSKYQQMNEQIHPTVHHQQQQQPLYSSGNANLRSINYYSQDPANKVHAPEMSPIIMKQTHSQYQYSRSPLPPPTQSQLLQTKQIPREVVEYLKKEDDPYDGHAIPSNRSMYVNPYNTPPSSDSCCKESSSPFTTTSNYRGQSPHAHLKYGKVVQETITTNKMSIVNQNTPPTSRTPSFRGHTYYYETQNVKYDNTLHMANSPAAASVASPSPSLSTSHQMNHSNYAPQHHIQQAYHHQHHNVNNDTRRLSVKGNEISVTHNNDLFELQQAQEPISKTACINFNKAQAVQMPQTSKKPHVPKPNYKELINQHYAMLNQTSEEEKNLKIIRKTLNVDAQTLKPVVVPSGNVRTAQPPIEKSQAHINVGTTERVALECIPEQHPYVVRESFRSEIVPIPLNTVLKSTIGVQDISRNIKQEDKPYSSPLDLSIRTVKTKADSTEYKYRRLPANAQSVDCKYALPRVNFTPNFSLHTADRNVITKPLRHSGNDSTERPAAYTSPEIRHIPYPKLDQPQQPPKVKHLGDSSMTTHSQLSYASKSQSTTLQHIPAVNERAELQITAANHSDIKPTSKPVVLCDIEGFQMRPSVLETNPYAAAKSVIPATILVDRNILAVDQLPPDTSIMALPKTPFAANPHMGGNSRSITKSPPVLQSAYSLACERNPNFLGRKRHLQEYSNYKYIEPALKQQRYQDVPPKSEYIRPADIRIIAINERVGEMECVQKAEKLIQDELPNNQPQLNSVIAVNNESIRICKKEPVTPDASPLPIAPIKTEGNSITAARIRTKAELKGFTFPSPMIEKCMIEVCPTKEPLKIKEEPIQIANEELPSIPGISEEFSQKSLLDFSWSNTCNNFVEQLLINSHKKPTKKKSTNIAKPLELSEDDLPVSEFVTKTDLANVSPDAHCHNANSKEVNISNMESNVSCGKLDANDSAITKSISQDTVCTTNTTVIVKKTNKLDREKMRIQQEKRIAARIQGGSSSETDNELDKRKSERLKKPLKKGKSRNNTLSDKNRFSDCGSDSSSSCYSEDKIVVVPLVVPLIQNNSTIERTKDVCLNVTSSQKTRESIVFKSSKKREIGANKDRMKNNVQTNITTSLKSDSNKKSAGDSLDTMDEMDGAAVHEKQKCKSKNKVQYTSACKRIIIDKPTRKPKVDLNTMTRSKRKRELEMQLANSKVLRNDKVIRNSMTKIKRKYVRKFAINQNCTGKEPVSRENGSKVISTRLRSKNEMSVATGKVKKNEVFNTKKLNKVVKNKLEKRKAESTSNSKEGKEQHANLYMEVYRYKRSLKVPPSLISIKHPSNHKIAASLPDLERDVDEELAISNRYNTKSPKLPSTPHARSNSKSLKSQVETKPLPQTHPERHRSIIDLLHSRVINSTAIRPKLKATQIANVNVTVSLNTHSENSQHTESNSVSELLPTLKKDDNIGDNDDDGKKRHFSIFDTKVLQTKTRTESKLQQKREIIREIFVGDDRPASAPPEITQAVDSGEKMTYEQKYEQFLEQMNIVINETKFGNATTSNAAAVLDLHAQQNPIKFEEDTESASAIDVDDKLQHDNQSIITGTPTNFRRRRPGKYLRRKGSSGFDYIRKKKKPTPVSTAASAQQNLAVVKIERTEEYDEFKIKTESDVCREIQKWVLNKGVGQSTMHKAARLGYMDVIVYCLDRMNMNPDQKDNAGYTPLHEASTNGWLDIARVLLQYGANHSEAALSGIRPLHEASENDHEEIVRLLLSYGSDPLLATYSGQTPLMLASSTTIRDILNYHLSDVQHVGPDKKPWRFNGPWEIFDAEECGYDIFGGAPNFTCDMSRAIRKSSVSSAIVNKKPFNQFGENGSKTVLDKCAVVLDNIDRFNSVRLYNDNKPEFLVENSDSEGEVFEFEEADVLLPPLYLLKDEGTDKWVLLSDLCNLLKVKSKDTLLNKIFPTSSVSSAHKSLMRELKMSDFLEKATCLQLLCVGEKINICASKVVLIKYNESVRNLLGVKTILMKF